MLLGGCWHKIKVPVDCLKIPFLGNKNKTGSFSGDSLDASTSEDSFNVINTEKAASQMSC